MSSAAPQLDLFNLNAPKVYPDPPHRGRATQIIAADKVKPATPNMRARVLAFITERGEVGATRQEIADGLGMLIQTVCGRVSELIAAGDIREDGDRTRDSRAVLVVTPCSK